MRDTLDKAWILILLIVVIIESTVAMDTAGLSLTLSQRGLNYAADIAVDQMVAEMQGQTIPDQSGQEGSKKYSIEETRVNHFTRPSSSVVISPGSGITWTLSGASVAISGKWHYQYKKNKFLRISDHGRFDVTVSNAHLSAGITMGVDPNGRPTISMTSCTSGVGDVSVKFHGGLSFLYNIFARFMEKPISDKIKHALCTSARRAIDESAARSLGKMRVQVPIADQVNIDYQLVSPPLFGDSFLESKHKGEFVWTEASTSSSISPNTMDIPRDTQKMVTLCLSEYVMNTLGHAVHNKGLLVYNLTRADIPEKHCGFLGMSCSSGMCVGSFLPQLSAAYPEGSLELHMHSSSPPRLTTRADGITGTMAGGIEFNVRLPNGDLKKAFTANIESTMNLTVSISGSHVTGVVTDFRIQVLSVTSEFGDIEKLLQLLLDIAGQHFILRKLNEVAERGLDLPSIDHVQFIDPEIMTIEGAICFRVDARYEP